MSANEAAFRQGFTGCQHPRVTILNIAKGACCKQAQGSVSEPVRQGAGVVDFTIAEVPIGAGVAGICALPEAPGDLAAIGAFKPDVVVSLTETHEMRHAGMNHPAADFAAMGLAWLHLPVPDYGIPGLAADCDAALWRLGSVLDGGGRVLIHCRAGLGRSGSVLLALMIAAGEGGEAALHRLRSVRPGAVETEAQRLWAEGWGRGRHAVTLGGAGAETDRL
jgi:hypothetical protein